MKKILISTVLVIAIPVVTYTLIKSKNDMQPSTSMVHSFTITDEKTFLESMIPHHQEAVDTSLLILSQAQNTELKQFAQQVVEAQTKEITQMKEWLRLWYSTEYKPNSTYEPMMTNLTEFKNTEQEKAYIEGMIRHHQGAIEMAKKVLTLNPRSEIKQMAQGIISAQESEVNILQQWLEKKYSGIQGEDKALHDIQIH